MLTDEDLMPFGKHQTKKLKDVPQGYLDYMYKQIRPIAYNKMYLKQKDFIKWYEEKYKDKKDEYYKGLQSRTGL